MYQEFCIYPKKCSAECDTLKDAAKSLQKYKGQLEDIKKIVATLKGDGYSDVAAYLSDIITNVEAERQSLLNLQNVLSQSVQLYLQTESTITATVVNGMDAMDLNHGIDDVLADILSGIGDFRGNEFWVALESILLKGILTDFCLDDIGKILSGTYLSSYWKNGQMYLKLNFDELTNKQAAEWLAENLGGKWDDYLARNMKNNGFSIFDLEKGILKDFKKFDDITDAELLKYFDDLKKIDKLIGENNFSFFQTYQNHFNILDDFDYSKFDELGKLGKAGKILGTVGTVFTIGSDVVDNFYDDTTETWSFSGNQLADCAADIIIDVGAGVGTTALGATIGSFIVPPVGTVVGAGVGFLADVALNWDFDGDGAGKSVIDTIKDGADVAVDWAEDAIDSALDWGADALDNMGDWFSAAFAF